MGKIKIYHFHNGNEGGVLSVIKNLLQYSSSTLIENHIIHTINRDLINEYKIQNIEGAITEKVFYYSSRWNFYYTCKQLAKLLPDDKAIIVAHDWLELGMVSNLGLQNKVIQILHGDYDYYYSLAKLHTKAIDSYIAVAASIKDKLQSLLPERKNDIQYLRFPVPESTCDNNTMRNNNSIIFIGRCTEDKGYHLLPTIAKSLAERKINLQWNIAGDLTGGKKYVWDSSVDVAFHGIMPNTTLNRLLCKMEYFILPSVSEGMPVSLIESMKAGVIPIINNMAGGVQELIIDGKTGYKAKINAVAEYVYAIESIVDKSSIKSVISDNCRAIANSLFNPYVNTENYEKLFLEISSKKYAKKLAIKVYGSRFDKKWISNTLTKFVRSFK